ncbi:DnaD domain-containing protein [Lactococcus lactis]|uniref:DnaD domain-containing protein n=1 Tax=Lactococcus lactis TaxID=1358 RepID=UPI001F0EFDE0|nr:DnaD domain protein [Lactococcus lactis]MDT2872843.1 DnaD domain protein [Lactococcus lactis]MDT2934680.1 DnaD domain protein [Lactococcus lactis]
MANKRMFSLDVVDSDRFMEMGVSARELYFQLGMRGDDDGFVGNPKRIMRSVGASEDDLKILQAKEFIHEFESGVIVILDWRLNNNLRNDRYKPTIYTEERKQLRFGANRRYLIGIPVVNQIEADIQSQTTENQAESTVYQTETNGNRNITKHSITEPNITQPNLVSSNSNYINNIKEAEFLEISDSDSTGGILKELINVFEQEMGFLSPTSMEELRRWLFEDNYSAEVIKLALKEAVLNRKVTLNYIKAILRNWRNDGITSAQAVQKNKEEREASKTTSKVWNGPDIPLDGPWNGTEG